MRLVCDMSRRQLIADLGSQAPVILPSLLLCDFGRLADEVARLEDAGVRALHLDVMDGHFVPNMTYGLTIVEALRRLTDLPLDVHLMISNPADYLSQYYEAGSDAITIHVEATSQPRALLQQIRDLGAAAGLALNPDTPIESIEECLDLCDLVLVMSVNAGFGGQAFNPVALDKLKHVASRVGDEVLLEVDGGVNAQTIAQCAEAGAQLFVAGSAIFGSENYRQSVAALRERASANIRT